MDTKVYKEIENFFSKYPLKEYKKGQILIYAGDNPPGIFHILKGEIRQYDITKNGVEVVLNVFRSPAFFPMSWAINKTPNEYFFETASDVRLRLAPAEDVTEFIKSSPTAMYDLLSRLYMGTDGLLKRLTYLMGGNAKTQLLNELIVEAKRFGQKKDNGYAIKIHESELAARTGLTRETVSRELHKLQQRGLLTVVRKSIAIENLARLEEQLADNL